MKKTTIQIIFLIIFFNCQLSISQLQGFYDKYYTGVMQSGYGQNFTVTDMLKVNTWVRYSVGGNNGWTELVPQDVLNADINNYKNGVVNVITQNDSRGLRTLMTRVKPEYLAYGQRSDYQCEAGHLNPYYTFYSYENHTAGVSVDYDDNGASTDGGALWVRHSVQGTHNAGIVCSGLLANREQINTRAFSGGWMVDFDNDYYVKPRIRIPQGIPNSNPNLEICKIYIKNWEGSDAIQPVIIYARNFIPNLQTQYDGQYREEFYFISNQTPSGILIDLPDPNPDEYNPLNPNERDILDGNCQVDFSVEWLGQCEMWIDYVRVDDNVADLLFKGFFETQNNNWFKWEASDISEDPSTNGNVLKFYMEEFEFNNIPCMAKVNEKLKYYSHGKYGLMADLNYGEYYVVHRKYLWNNLPPITADYVKTTLIDAAGLDEIYTFSYPFMGYLRGGGTGWMGRDVSTPVYVPSTLSNNCGYNESQGRFAEAVSPAYYDNWLQGYIDNHSNEFNSEYYTGTMKFALELSKLTQKPFVNLLQSNLWYAEGNNWTYIQREPTNEEMKMMAYLAVTYGAKSQFWFWWGSDGVMPSSFFARGLKEYGADPYAPRHENVYGQYQNGAGTSKITTVGNINEKLAKWGSSIMNTQISDINSFRYYDPAERAAFRQNYIISDIYSYAPDCPETTPALQPDAENETFIQAAEFDKQTWEVGTSDHNERYFMILNRRCSPHTQNDCGGLRNIRIKFADFNFPATIGFLRFRNLNIIDLETGNIVATFDKHQNNSHPIIDLGWFEPGEGKLYKLAPTLLTGGTLVADEDLNLTPSQYHVNNYDVTGTVYSNGHNVIFQNPITFNFAENTGWVLENCEAGLSISSGYGTMQGKNGSKWNGITLNNCSYVNSVGLTYKDIKNGNYALNMTNPANLSLWYCTFDYSENNSIAGGVNVYSNLSTNPYHLLTNCTFNMGSSNMQAVNIVSSPFTCRIIFDYLNINRSYENLSIGIFLDGCTGTIKNSYINQPFQDLIAMNSNLDLYRNQFYSSEPVYGTAYSYINMAPTVNVQLAGYNTLGNGYRNLIVLNSRFNLYNGGNSFNVATVNDKHLLGYFPADDDISGIDVSGNCFYVNSSATNPLHYITLGSGGQQLNVLYNGGNNCINQQGDIAFISNTNSGEYNDTVFYTGMQNLQYGPAELLLQNISVNSRKKQFDSVVTQATHYLTNYADSIGSTEAVEELFYATIEIDENGNKISQLKTKYEELILNNPENIPLCNMLFYYIQKCKVALGEFNSALSGFQQIINQNPYTYEGLIASWDYMSAYLLDSSGGSGGEAGNINNDGDDIKIRDDFDKDKFNEDQRNSIKQSIINVLQNTKKIQDYEVISLKQKEIEGDKEAGQKLKIKQALNDAVKIKRPRDESEYVKIVESDIKKIFGIGEIRNSSNNNSSNIPKVFRISQNYPNPFNPVTKINYDLPKDSKVNIIIYDILGREVKRLVNNELKTAGSYIVDFNASNYASGVYFYRIEAEEPNGSKFVDSKKMVLLK